MTNDHIRMKGKFLNDFIMGIIIKLKKWDSQGFDKFHINVLSNLKFRFVRKSFFFIAIMRPDHFYSVSHTAPFLYDLSQ
jgi:hypothetical protein